LEDLVIVGQQLRLSAAKIPIAGAAAFSYAIIITDASPFVKHYFHFFFQEKAL